MRIECIDAAAEIFYKEPQLVVKAYEDGYDFEEFVDAIRDADPDMALAGIEFWKRFIMINPVEFCDEFKMKLF